MYQQIVSEGNNTNIKRGVSVLLVAAFLWLNGGVSAETVYFLVAELGTEPYHWRRDFDDNNSVDGQDCAGLSSEWMRNDCIAPDRCGGRDLDKSGAVDYDDLRLFVESWLSPYAEEPIWFDAWNCTTQCHGDGNCSRRTDSADLLILQACAPLPVYYGELRYDPRVDCDRDLDVDTNDQATIEYWFMRMPLPADCPPAPF